MTDNEQTPPQTKTQRLHALLRYSLSTFLDSCAHGGPLALGSTMLGELDVKQRRAAAKGHTPQAQEQQAIVPSGLGPKNYGTINKHF
ncbi:MAG: hypothetical protein DHS20C10_06020 [marine bacterium B5-7]|nr:MAG: hypothetical protein DHS20C10_06020 [marine bacterium B5-7]